MKATSTTSDRAVPRSKYDIASLVSACDVRKETVSAGLCIISKNYVSPCSSQRRSSLEYILKTVLEFLRARAPRPARNNRIISRRERKQNRMLSSYVRGDKGRGIKITGRGVAVVSIRAARAAAVVNHY
ncbi:hypothetical protein EVAR_46117_1 [Eumeta japonica]|uniref:Uncharacterized protein n=1 Tax=Eumeta variegata TaxID=151549 RepID=A0A4C1XP42_EUMVA|nr:hypothetical protein EVAR_46117_1 [Eumeta japonica]